MKPMLMTRRRVLARDAFSTAVSPVSVPRACEPGPGTLTFLNGTFDIQAGGVLKPTGTMTAPYWILGGAGKANGKVSATVAITADAIHNGLVCRYADASNFIALSVELTAVRLKTVIAGTITDNDSVLSTPIGEHTLTLAYYGTQIIGMLDGVVVKQIACPFLTDQTIAGVRLLSVNSYAKNLTIR